MIRTKHGRAAALATLALLVATLPALRLALAQPGVASERTWWRESFDSPPLDFVDPFGHDPRLLARVYGVLKDADDPVLHALHDDVTGSLPAVHYGRAFERSPPPLERVRALRWRWRVLRHPDVGNDAWADVAASLYVIVRSPSFLHGGRGFKFGWLAKPGPDDTYQHGILQLPLQEAGQVGTWRSESVDLCALYRRTFGACEGEHVLYVGVMTDADTTRSTAEAEYDDFELVATPEP